MMRLVTLVSVAVAAIFALAPAHAADVTGTLKKIKDSGTIVLGHREASVPFASIGPDQKPQGYSIDLCMKIVEAVKAELGVSKLEVKLVPISPQTRIPLLANGTIDLECGSTTNSLTRAQQVDFTHITYITGTKLLVKKSSGIKEVEDLNGKILALAQGTTNERSTRAVLDAKGIKPRILNVKDNSEAFVALETDRVDAFATDDILLYGLITKAKRPDDFEVVGRYLSYDPYALMIRRDDSTFRLIANKTLSGLYRSGEIDALHEKWFGAMKVPMSEMLRNAFTIQALPE